MKLTYKLLLTIMSFCLAALCITPANAQGVTAGRCVSLEESAFDDGEELTYLANYKWGIISSDVGEATLSLSKYEEGNQPFYFLEAKAKTYKFYDKVFKVRDTYMSRFSAVTMKPVYFHRNIFEGGYVKRNTLNFDWKRNQIKSTTQRYQNTPVDSILKVSDCTFDVMSLLYYSRNMNFSNIQPGSSFPLTFAIDNEVYNIKYRFVGRETISLKNVGKFRTLKFAVEVVAGDVFTGEQELYIWITDDKNHIPLIAETPIIVGKVRVMLMKMSNLKHPLTSKI